jgi:hypothetical protein
MSHETLHADNFAKPYDAGTPNHKYKSRTALVKTEPYSKYRQYVSIINKNPLKFPVWNNEDYQ